MGAVTTRRTIYTETNIRSGLSQYISHDTSNTNKLAITWMATSVIVKPKCNLEDRELRRQFNTKCVNQWDRTLLEVDVALLVKLTALDAELDKICGKAGRVDEEEEPEENDVLEGWWRWLSLVVAAVVLVDIKEKKKKKERECIKCMYSF